MRFFLDEDVRPDVAETARSLGLDVVSVHEIGRHGFSDEEQLRWAAAEGRILVTRNRNDFIELGKRFFERLEPFAGILISTSLPNSTPAPQARALLAWAQRWKEIGGPDPYHVEFLSRPAL